VGTHDLAPELDAERLRVFTRKLLTDLRAIEQMLDHGAIESGVRRIGAEQELFLVGPRWGASCNNLDILADLADDAHFTTELGRFNIEFNLDPMSWGGNCLSQMESQLEVSMRTMTAERDQFGAVLESMTEAVLALDDAERVVLFNRAATELFGVTERGAPLPASVRNPVLDKLIEEAKLGRAGSEEVSVGDDDERVLRFQVSPQQDRRGAVVVIHDVSQMRRLERSGLFLLEPVVLYGVVNNVYFFRRDAHRNELFLNFV